MKSKNVSHFLISIFILIAIATPVQADTATVHGAVYDWYTFDLLENTVVEVNSTPPQSVVAKHGIYSFDLSPGEYQISARYYEDGTLRAYTEERITIEGQGNYVLDLLLLPAFDDEDLIDSEFNEDMTRIAEERSGPADDDPGISLDMSTLILVFTVFLILIMAGYFLWKNNSAVSMPEKEEKKKDLENNFAGSSETLLLSPDLQEVLDIISSHEGRITQKELRKRMNHSEAKISLMLSELEHHGLIEKFKHGRGNVIILVHTPENGNK